MELHLAGMRDAECYWEPASPCWNVRSSGGHWVADWVEPEPTEPMVTSIAWLLWHIGFWWSVAYDHAFGNHVLRREDVEWAGDAEAAVALVQRCYGEWKKEIEALSEGELDVVGRSTWPYPQRPLAYVIAWVNSELMKNAAEIGVTRHLFATTARPS